MKIDHTPALHALIAVLVQLVVWVIFGSAWLGGLIACVWWVAREHTQAEYRWIATFGAGKRLNMPQWGGFDPRVWDLGSLLDFLVPILSCIILYLFIA